VWEGKGRKKWPEMSKTASKPYKKQKKMDKMPKNAQNFCNFATTKDI